MTTVSPLVQACADKLQREMEEFGFPPEFPEEEEEDTSSKKARHCKHANKQGPPSKQYTHISAVYSFVPLCGVYCPYTSCQHVVWYIIVAYDLLM